MVTLKFLAFLFTSDSQLRTLKNQLLLLYRYMYSVFSVSESFDFWKEEDIGRHETEKCNNSFKVQTVK